MYQGIEPNRDRFFTIFIFFYTYAHTHTHAHMREKKMQKSCHSCHDSPQSLIYQGVERDKYLSQTCHGVTDFCHEERKKAKIDFFQPLPFIFYGVQSYMPKRFLHSTVNVNV